MVYQHYLIIFLVVKQTDDNAYILINIYNYISLGGPSRIIQSKNGKKLLIIINRNVWSKLRIVHGRPRHISSIGNIERVN